MNVLILQWVFRTFLQALRKTKKNVKQSLQYKT